MRLSWPYSINIHLVNSSKLKPGIKSKNSWAIFSANLSLSGSVLHAYSNILGEVIWLNFKIMAILFDKSLYLSSKSD